MAERVERVFPGQAIIDREGRVLASPFQFTTDGDDNLRLVSANSLVGVRLQVQGRRLDEKGRIKTFAFDHVPNSDRTATTTNHPFGLGALLNLTVSVSAGSPVIGQTYVTVQLIRGLSGAMIVLGTLLGGYVTATQFLGWPGSPIVSSTSGEPAARVIVGTDPAADTIVTETVPTGARWELLSVQVTLVKGGASAAGVTLVQVSDPANDYGRYSGGTTGGILTTNLVTFAQGLPIKSFAAGGDTTVNGPLPRSLILLAGHRFQVTDTVFGNGDNFGRPGYSVREWLEVG